MVRRTSSSVSTTRTAEHLDERRARVAAGATSMGTDRGSLGQFFPGDSELTRHMRELDWGATVFGPSNECPKPLKHSVSLCLTARFSIVMYWGPEPGHAANWCQQHLVVGIRAAPFCKALHWL